MSLQHILDNKIPHKPILYSTPMVQAILAGRKTQTRRDSGLKKVNPLATDFRPSTGWPKQGDWIAQFKYENQDKWEVTDILKCPFGQPGDLLWVRETWQDYGFEGNTMYKADHPEFRPDDYWEWRPSIHMPKEYARIWLQIKSVRVHRLKDISKEDAIAEGVIWQPGIEWTCEPGKIEDAYAAQFKKLWQSIHGPDSWNLNPWVWVIEFEVLSTNGAPDLELLLSSNLIREANL